MSEQEQNERPEESSEEEEQAAATGAEADEKGGVHPSPDPIRDY